MNNLSIFDYTDYIPYLDNHVRQNSKIRGFKSAMAKSIDCQSAYVTQIFSGKSNLSLEQTEKLSKFLAHNEDECFYFLLLVQFKRSGTKPLKKIFHQKIEEFQKKQSKLHNLITAKGQIDDDLIRSRYYSSWKYSAIHLLLTLPNHSQPIQIGRSLKISLESVNEVLHFLCDAKLAIKDDLNYRPSNEYLHLPGDHHMISTHHTNWRNMAISHFQRGLNDSDSRALHYSSVKSFSESDLKLIKKRLTAAILEIKEIAKNTKKEEKIYSFCVDFFSLI